MIIASEMFQQAQLAEASYARFQNFTDPKDALLAAGMSNAQATALLSQWRVVNHTPNTATGFSATLFERLDEDGNGTGEFNLAIRGSEFDNLLQDFRADAGDIFLDGVVLDQMVDLYNYWQRLSAPTTGTYTA